MGGGTKRLACLLYIKDNHYNIGSNINADKLVIMFVLKVLKMVSTMC